MGKCPDCRSRLSALSDEFGAQHEAFDALVATIDLLRIPCQADRPNDRSAPQRLVRTFDLQILGEHDAIAGGQEIADGIAYLDRLDGRLPCLCVRPGNPFTGRFVKDIVVIRIGHVQLASRSESRSALESVRSTRRRSSSQALARFSRTLVVQ